MLRSLAALCILLPSLTIAAPWKLVAQKRGIKVYSREVAGSPLIEFKGTMGVNAPLKKVLGVLLDYPNYRKWNPDLLAARKLKIYDERHWIIYFAVDLPWPVSNRDIVSDNLVLVDTRGEWFHLKWKGARHSSMPVKSEFIRVPVSRGKWSMKQIKNGAATWAEFRGFGDPGGAIPKWLVNWVAKNQVADSLDRLRQRVRKGQYSQQILNQFKFTDSWGRKKK